MPQVPRMQPSQAKEHAFACELRMHNKQVLTSTFCCSKWHCDRSLQNSS